MSPPGSHADLVAALLIQWLLEHMGALDGRVVSAAACALADAPPHPPTDGGEPTLYHDDGPVAQLLDRFGGRVGARAADHACAWLLAVVDRLTCVGAWVVAG